MRDLPVFEGPLPEGLTTVREWAPRINRSPGYVNRFWRQAVDPPWPAPVGQRPERVGGRRGGGLQELVYDQAELDNFRAGHPEYWPESRVVPVDTKLAPSTLVTLGQAAEIIGVNRKTLSQYPHPSPGSGRLPDPNFPQPVKDDVWRLGNLLAFWPYPVDTKLAPPTLVTRQQFAELAGVTDATVARYRSSSTKFPSPLPYEVYRLGEVLAYWSSRPGKRSAPKRSAGAPGARRGSSGG